MKTIILSLLVVVLTACTASPTKTPAPIPIEDTQTQIKTEETKAPTQTVKNCICVKMWMPVCGKNNQTYGNSCEAECAGVKYTQGACNEKK